MEPARAEAEAGGLRPIRPHDLSGQREIGLGVGKGADAARGLEPDRPLRRLDHAEHGLDRRRAGRMRGLAG